MWALGTGVFSSSRTSFPRERPPTKGARSRDEKLFDALLAASVVFWAIAGLEAARAEAVLVRGPLLVVHLAVAALLVLRTRPLFRGSVGATLASLPAFAVAGFAFRLRAADGTWPPGAEALFAVGSVITVWAFASLGRNFAILPAVRGVVTRGAYRWVRHPAYAGELLMVLACALSRPGPISTLLWLAAIPLVALRIRVEESLLRGSSDLYRTYTERVRFRLVPGLW